jgi:hypothetical protein
MQQDVDLSDFTGGELSPKLKGRTDLKKYFSSCATILNMVVMPQGGATKRPPTLYVANNKNQSGLNRPVRFVFSTVQAYTLEFSNTNVRIYANDGVVLNAGVPVDVVVPYVTADLLALKFCQSADTLFIFHPSYPPAKLVRSSHTSWAHSNLVFRDGPYLPVNTTTTTITPSAASGAITLTASAALFAATDVGRPVRIKLYSLWAWCLITAYTDSTHVSATVQPGTNFGGPRRDRRRCLGRDHRLRHRRRGAERRQILHRGGWRAFRRLGRSHRQRHPDPGRHRHLEAGGRL